MNPPDYSDASLDELRMEAREIVLELPAGVQSKLEQWIDDQEVVASIVDEIPIEQRRRIETLFTALFEKTWQQDRATVGAGAPG